MPNRDTFTVLVTVRDDYEDEGTILARDQAFLSPGQRKPETVASVLRSAALRVSPEDGDTRSEEFIYAALDRRRADLLRPRSGVGPATRALLIGQLWDIAGYLGLEWYGVRS